MRSIQCVCNLDTQIQHRFHFQRLAIDPMSERLPLQQFHGNEGSSIDLIYFVNSADVRMVQRGRSLGLPLKTAESLCIVGEFIRKELKGDVATQLEIFRLVHNTHSAATQPLHNAVVRNGLADHWAEILGPELRQVNAEGG